MVSKPSRACLRCALFVRADATGSDETDSDNAHVTEPHQADSIPFFSSLESVSQPSDAWESLESSTCRHMHNRVMKRPLEPLRKPSDAGGASLNPLAFGVVQPGFRVCCSLATGDSSSRFGSYSGGVGERARFVRLEPFNCGCQSGRLFLQ